MENVFRQLLKDAGTDHILAPLQHTPMEVIDDLVTFSLGIPPSPNDDEDNDETRNIQPRYIVEIGSGDGRILLEFARRTARFGTTTRLLQGFEIDEVAYSASLARLAQEEAEVAVDAAITPPGGCVQFILEDVLTSARVVWPEIDLLFMYITTSGLRRLWPLFCERCRPGTKVVSVQFQIDGVEAAEAYTSTYIDLRGEEISFTFYEYHTPR